MSLLSEVIKYGKDIVLLGERVEALVLIHILSSGLHTSRKGR
jgi:hypothetical protein